MMKFKVGDKVAVYNVDRTIGLIQEIDVDDTVMVDDVWVHVKQCRKITDKKEIRLLKLEEKVRIILETVQALKNIIINKS